MRKLKARLLAATALVAGGDSLLALPAQADEGRLRPHQGPVVEIGLQGSFLFNAGDERSAVDPFDDKLGDLSDLDSGDYGQSFGVTARWNLDERWAVQVGMNGTWLSQGESHASDYEEIIFDPQLPPLISGSDQRGTFESSYAILEGAAVYRLGDPGWGMERIDLLVGLRGLQSEAEADYSYAGTSNGDVEISSRGWYLGPMVGVGATLPLGGAFALVGQASGSVLFGSREDQSVEDGNPQVDVYDSNTVYTLEGSLALQYAIAPGVALQGGYRAQQLWNAGVRYEDVEKTGDFESGEADLLVHGAFVSINLQF